MLSFQNVLGRTAITLSELAAKYGKSEGAETVRIDADITQQELADLIGTAREMVTRALSSFRSCPSQDPIQIAALPPLP